MKCPICGEESIKSKRKCLRCGYEFTDMDIFLQEGGNDNVETVNIDPSRVRITGGVRRRGNVFGDIHGSGFFGGGIFGTVIDDIFGDLFGGFGSHGGYTPDEGYSEWEYDDFGTPMKPIKRLVDVHDVEIIKPDTSNDSAAGGGNKKFRR